MKKNNLKYNQQSKNIFKDNSLNTIYKKNNSVIYIIIAFIFPVLLYLQTINYGFTCFDDDSIISKNIPFLSNIKNAAKVFQTDAFIVTDSSTVNNGSFYRPVQTLSYMIDLQFEGAKDTWMFHLSNVLLLGFIASLIFILLKRFLIPPKLALLSTLIFCVNPLFVSSIAWIPARGDLQLTLFSILSFLFVIEFLKKDKILYLFLNWIAFTIALFSKETAAVLPILFIIYYFTLKNSYNKLYLLNFTLYFVSGIIWFYLRYKAVGGITNHNYPIGFISILSNLQNIPESLIKFFLPFDNNPLPIYSVFKTIAGLVVIVFVIIIFFKSNERTKKEKIFCLSWFLLLMLPPMLYKHPSIEYLDHRFLLPLIGILLFVLFSLPKKWFEDAKVKRYWLMIAIIVFLSSFTFIKSRQYSDPHTYFNSAISSNSNSSFAYYCRALIKDNKKDYQAAIDDYNKAIDIKSKDADLYIDRGIDKNYINDYEGAIEDFNKAIVINPNNANAYKNRGSIKSSINDFKGAIDDFNKAISINPTDYLAYYHRGNIKQNMGDLIGALDDFNKTIAINPKIADAYNSRGVAKRNKNDYNGAIEDFNKAIAIKPGYSEAYNNKGTVMGMSGKFKDAIICFNKAIEINPNSLDVYFNRAKAKYFIKDLTGAIEDCENALTINPNYENALNLKYKAQDELKKGKVIN